MKLFALPLAKLPDKAGLPLFYLHAQRLNPPAPTPPQTTAESLKTLFSSDVPLATRATEKAASFWNAFGEAKTGSWKRRVYTTGDRLMDKIPFEEWSLKSIDPALAPKLWNSYSTEIGQEWKNAGRKPLERVSLLFPPSLLSPAPLLSTLKEQLAHRGPHHKQAMIKCLLVAPLTFPFAIIPLVPNFPLFYVLWRAWSHYRAFKSSQYLAELLSTSQIHLIPSPELDKIYTPPKSDAPDLLLTPSKLPDLVGTFKFSAEDEKALRRSVMQAGIRLERVRSTEDKSGKQE